MKDWFKARNIWGAAIESLSDDEAGRLAKALWRYTMTGKQTDLEGAEKGIFAMMLLTLGQDEEREADISTKRSIASKSRFPVSVASNAEQMISNDSKCNQLISNDDIKNKNKNKNKEQDIDIHKRFTPPTLEEVTEYCKERGNSINPAYFIDYHVARDWVLSNGKKMKDWKATIRTWENNSFNRQKPKTVVAQQYEQRDYSGEQDEAMQRMLKLVNGA